MQALFCVGLYGIHIMMKDKVINSKYMYINRCTKYIKVEPRLKLIWRGNKVWLRLGNCPQFWLKQVLPEKRAFEHPRMNLCPSWRIYLKLNHFKHANL